MPRLLDITDTDLRDETIDWDAFCASIDSDTDPRESKRPVEDDEWADEDDYADDDRR